MKRKSFPPLLLLLTSLFSAAANAQTAADVASVRAAAHQLHGTADDYDALISAAGDRRLVMLGEATHGTAEFYRERMRITQRMIVEKGVRAVALEGDWRDVARVDRYVRGEGDDTLSQALSEFTRFPVWMWHNAQFGEFVQWLRNYNASLDPASPKVRIFGMDLYGIYQSVDALETYLASVDPAAEARAKERFACMEKYRANIDDYMNAGDCRDGSAAELEEMQARYGDATRNGDVDEALFFALQDARVVSDGEAFYRAVGFGTSEASWNVRDQHMVDTLDALMSYLDTTAPPSKIVTWTHNTHAGDARATDSVIRGEWNVAQLARDRWPNDTIHVGFLTYNGTVMAAKEWGNAGSMMTLRNAITSSDANLFHQTGLGNFYVLTNDPAVRETLVVPRLQRAVGVVYAPATELISHYFNAVIGRQFDAVIHIDATTAVNPVVTDPAQRRRVAISAS
ncbi:MAG TPA: erythromycin esterase family protein [Thermoanaerobaculia bacterium]|nr:erythromycin esterase family protein [Thermoanaerobaculia bacterium]